MTFVVLFLFSQYVLVVQGALYKLGDFQIRVIKVVPNQAESLRGIMIEVTNSENCSGDNTRLLHVLDVVMIY